MNGATSQEDCGENFEMRISPKGCGKLIRRDRGTLTDPCKDTPGAQSPDFPLQDLPGWAAWLALDLGKRFAIPTDVLILAALAVSGGLLGSSLTVVGLAGRPYHPVLHGLIALSPSPIARRAFLYFFQPVYEALNKARRLGAQPRLPLDETRSNNDRRFGSGANPASPFASKETALDRLVKKPGLLCAAADISLIRELANASIDRSLVFDGTDQRFARDLLELDSAGWRNLHRTLDNSFYQEQVLPGSQPGTLAALWSFLPGEIREWWAHYSRRGGRRFPPLIVLDGGLDGGELDTDPLSSEPEHFGDWRQWCETLLDHRFGLSKLEERRFGKRGLACLVAFHNELIGLEKTEPIARSLGVMHFLSIAERMAALLSLTDGEAEIAASKVSLGVQLARAFCHRHLDTLERLLEPPVAPAGHIGARQTLEERVLQKIVTADQGLTIRSLMRRLHRAPDAASLRLTLRQMEIEGTIKWSEDRIVGASAPTDGDDGAPTPKEDCEPLTGADTLPATLEPPPAL